MGTEILLGFAALLLTASVSGIGGAFWIQVQGSERIEKIKKDAQDREDKIFSENKEKVDLVLYHVQKVQDAVNDIRAELPTKYVLKEDHYRLAEKVDSLKAEYYKIQSQGPKST